MELLKKENWWMWLLITIFSGGTGYIALGALLEVYDRNAWYANWKNWLIGLVCFIFPAFIMGAVFVIQLMTQAAAKLHVAGSELYLSPFIWILCLIVPLIGWIMFCVMLIYLQIWILVKLYQGNGEEYL